MRYLKFLAIGLLMTTSGITLAQQAQDPRMQVAREGTPEEKAALEADLRGAVGSYTNEDEYRTAQYLFYALGYQDVADSLNLVAVEKFPKGRAARSAFVTDVFYEAEDVKAKEKVYKKILKKWPVAKFAGDEVVYDYMTASLSRDYAEIGDFDKAIEYLGELRERFWRGNGYLPVAQALLTAGDTARALPLIQLVEEDAYYFLTLPEEEKDNKARFAAVGYPGAVSMLADVYTKQGDYEKALQKIEEAIQAAPDQADRFAASYAVCLEAAGRKLEALNELAKIYKTGQFGVADKMKELYAELNTTTKGFERYQSALQEGMVAKIREHIKTLEQYKPAPDFELLNLDGQKVALSSLKGKVVVLDFWATWCQPCIRSFPGMKAAQEMYADDDAVEFLFINTWERTEDYKEQVAAFIEKHAYPFEVLFDDQVDPATKQNLAAAFGVQGIPAKFIIDKEGNIRYALTGSSPQVEYIKMEMKELIEAAKEPMSAR
ncbi:redoxin domain-containing protein [Parapedobacter sp. 10938]|uniref:redoxin domain-containing protein n=1 Tax=Parapedobacter flavus TaxID=3110225 RepID=UPI002DBFDAB8|nr:redoxin domain-containing protein [Parapedobacter sp. 10938]MEC3878239.1 redoxin domain-containing protein [Parapedobacter sp. 10938]